MMFALDFNDISLFFAVTAIVLLVASELLSPHYGKANVLINKKRLRNTAIVTSTLFLFTVAIRILSILITP